MATNADNIDDAIQATTDQIKWVSEHDGPDVSIGGKNVSKVAYMDSLIKRLDELTRLRQRLDGPFMIKNRLYRAR